MKRSALYLMFFIIVATSLWSQDIQTLSRKELTNVYIIIPFEYFIWTADSDQIKYELKISIINAKKKSVYQNVLDIKFDKKNIIKGAALVKEIEFRPDNGKYTINTQLRNSTLGDKRNSKHEFIINKLSPPSDLTLLIADNGFYKFIPSEIAQLNKDLVSADLLLDFKPEIDSLIIRLETDSGLRKVTLLPQEDKYYDLLPLLGNGIIHNISLQYISKNIMYRSETFLNQKRFKYNQIYSMQDQLQQIKYIANQNEWKILKKTSADNLAVVIEEFWLGHNTIPDSQSNITREVFNERVIKADELFTIHKKMNGWKSDRGRIFIKYGPPDEITSDIYPSGRFPYIKWYYYREYKTYYFVDKSGYGNYQLMEVEDEN